MCCGLKNNQTKKGLRKYQVTDPQGNVTVHETSVAAKMHRQSVGGGLLQVIYVRNPE